MEEKQHSSGIPLGDPLLADLECRLRSALGFNLTAVEPIVLGLNNNRLLRLYADDGRRAIAKVYYRDERGRLEREYGMLRFLRTRRLRRVATPLLRCHEPYYAVYSDEVGTTMRASDVPLAAMVDLGHFAAELHAVLPGTPGADFPPVAVACFSVAERVTAIRARLRAFLQWATCADAPLAVQRLCADIDVATVMEGLIAAAIGGLSHAEVTAVTPPEDRRLDSGDFAPHNVLVRPDGGVCVLDFENAGWDQPFALSGGFLTAATGLDLGKEQAASFLRAYREGMPTTEGDTVRFERFCVLQHLLWCGIHLSLTTPPYLARKRFANPDLDSAAVTADQIAQFRRRVVVAEAAVRNLRGIRA